MILRKGVSSVKIKDLGLLVRAHIIIKNCAFPLEGITHNDMLRLKNSEVHDTINGEFVHVNRDSRPKYVSTNGIDVYFHPKANKRYQIRLDYYPQRKVK